MAESRSCLSEKETRKALKAMAEEIGKQIHDPILIGIETGGVHIARILAAALKCPLGRLDISFYRDDFQRIGLHPRVTPTKLPLDLEGRHLVLVDDVIYTGRTVRAALNEIFDYGRPASVALAVMVDRNGRELPIQPDFAATRLVVAEDEHVQMNGSDPMSFSIVPG